MDFGIFITGYRHLHKLIEYILQLYYFVLWWRCFWIILKKLPIGWINPESPSFIEIVHGNLLLPWISILYWNCSWKVVILIMSRILINLFPVNIGQNPIGWFPLLSLQNTIYLYWDTSCVFFTCCGSFNNCLVNSSTIWVKILFSVISFNVGKEI